MGPFDRYGFRRVRKVWRASGPCSVDGSTTSRPRGSLIKVRLDLSVNGETTERINEEGRGGGGGGGGRDFRGSGLERA